ncbi:hypothetical protein [Autumnicola psychrophila]|uniref:Uncharacterized protein n=1 Tax=Autumnicola psychrophila TaxID=3075592 RepID=A0ABU3DQD5_9FLAO|nr:hypothetical protein [Zunongwangia sp. F225]MDT0685739.1 hypothetical protein [Zunongwangia sp. F225]
MSKANEDLKREPKEKKEDLPYNPDVTKEDKQALNEKGRSMNKGQDKALDRERPVDFTGKDLDIPASNDSLPDSDKNPNPDEQNFQFNERGARPDRDKAKDHPDSETDKP